MNESRDSYIAIFCILSITLSVVFIAVCLIIYKTKDGSCSSGDVKCNVTINGKDGRTDCCCGRCAGENSEQTTQNSLSNNDQIELTGNNRSVVDQNAFTRDIVNIRPAINQSCNAACQQPNPINSCSCRGAQIMNSCCERPTGYSCCSAESKRCPRPVVKKPKKVKNSRKSSKLKSTCESCLIGPGKGTGIKVFSHKCCYYKYENQLIGRSKKGLILKPNVKIVDNCTKTQSACLIKSRCGSMSYKIIIYHDTPTNLSYDYILDGIELHKDEIHVMVNIIDDRHVIMTKKATIYNKDGEAAIRVYDSCGQILKNGSDTNSVILFLTFCVNNNQLSAGDQDHCEDYSSSDSDCDYDYDSDEEYQVCYSEDSCAHNCRH